MAHLIYLFVYFLARLVVGADISDIVLYLLLMGYTREIYGECIVFTSNMHNMYSIFIYISVLPKQSLLLRLSVFF